MGKIVPIVVFGFDYDVTRTQAGSGTQLRCLEGAEVYNNLVRQGKDAFFIVSPGRAPGVTPEHQPETMAEMMARMLHVLGVPSSNIQFGRPTWGTHGELLEAVRIIQNMQRSGTEILTAYLVSNQWHLCRIRLLATVVKLNLGFDWKWKYSAAAWGDIMPFTLKEQLKEFGKIVTEFFQAWRWRP